MTNIDTVVNRIRKLMTLTTDRGASEAEAAIAAQHVQRLLAEHNLSMAAVEASGGSKEAGGKRQREGVDRRQVYKWQQSLMSAVAETNFCKAYARYTTRWSKPSIFSGYDLIGRADNVATTKIMFEYLLETIERLARDEVKDPTQYFTRYAHSFKEGCADRLIERLAAQHKQIVEEQERKAKEEQTRRQHPGAASSNLPVVIMSDFVRAEEDLNNDFANGWEPGTTAKNRTEYEARAAARQERAMAETAKREARRQQLISEGVPEETAYYMAMGYSREQAEELAKPETEAQRRRREQREERQRDRSFEQQWRAQQRERQRLDRTGYVKGHAAGADVGLNRQADHRPMPKIEK